MTAPKEKTESVSTKQVMGWSIALTMMLGGWLFTTIINGTRETRAEQAKKDSKQDLQIESNRLRIDSAKERGANDVQELKVRDKELEGRVNAVERNLDRVIEKSIE